MRSEPVNLSADATAIAREGARRFEPVAEDHYRLVLPALGITLEVDRLRRERGELIGELSVRCDIPGVRTVDGILTAGDLNLSSVRARADRAKLCAERSRTNGSVDWVGLIEELCQRVLIADRAGRPAVDLREFPAASADDKLKLDGWEVPRAHPCILFGDGGSAKSYLSLREAGRLAERGLSIAYIDWELSGDAHRERLERLFPEGMPRIMYARCERPLVYEVDRLKRIVREHRIDYAVFDSVAFAADGPPEAAEVAARYFRAVRQIGVGSLHVAHVSRAEDADKKPFGSAFWHNGGRATWYCKLAEGTPDSDEITIGLFNRKSNLGRLQRAVGFRIKFEDYQTTFTRTEVADNPELSEKLSLQERMAHLLKRGPMKKTAVAEELDAKIETVDRVSRRHKERFIVLDGGKVGLLQK